MFFESVNGTPIFFISFFSYSKSKVTLWNNIEELIIELKFTQSYAYAYIDEDGFLTITYVYFDVNMILIIVLVF